MVRQEQCNKVCRILDDVLANRPTERDSLIVAVRKAFNALEQAETNCSEIPNNSDTISRQQAVDFVGSMNMCDEISNEAYEKLTSYLDELPSAEPDTTTHDSIPAETGKNDGVGTSGDCISRAQAIDALRDYLVEKRCPDDGTLTCRLIENEVINKLPSAQPEPHEIGYSECANAMLKMWIDNVLTDGEYNRIMDKLNAHWAERREK